MIVLETVQESQSQSGNGSANGAMIERVPLRSLVKGVLLYRLTYVSEGLQVKGYLTVPDTGKPSPGLIYCRGGIRKVGMVRKRRIISMAKRGYAVFAPFYRGNEGGEGKEDFGGEDRFDVCHAITLVQSLPEVQPGPVPLIGFSRGAMMAMLAAKQCNQAGPVVVWGGVSDLFDTYEQRVDLRRMLKRVVGHPRKEPEAYESRSPVYWLEQVQVPIMIVHGTADPQVNVSHAHKLAEALERAGKDYAMELYEGLEHRFPKAADEKALDAVFAWISQKLREMSESKP
ncbi:prolyl oligopeptidase family serine peptidase [Paenibacillus sp. N5-1-1-5]|uniref:Prolyl oligopeptidase family serine peptidase n=2 Tax=Paenibacillus radicis (ex Xue et al. 2023) TaxID=2972489 RepID=A0ABT1Y994_9BACL|nr:prolyl oligopeptidase family serine peptidase [Paenibacillus radicis (ex Xue et al. 2023)]MCR8629756.1 prolyl oligopeptidase family serine peptidase [Paenibacillus radicis (ex Xue et al. 2023)]